MAACHDCGLQYPFGLDLVLPDQQWRHLFPEGGDDGCGLLCPNCIAKRADRLGDATCILAWIDCIDWEAPRPPEWFEDN